MIIGIDPGTHCGWAVRSETGDIVSGEWNLASNRFEGGGMRFVRLRRFLIDLITSSRPKLVAYEEVRRHLGTDAAHIYGGIISHVQQVCEELKVPYLAIPVHTVKKFATGKGGSKKDEMIRKANERWPGHCYSLKDNNEVDARWIVECAVQEVK